MKKPKHKSMLLTNEVHNLTHPVWINVYEDGVYGYGFSSRKMANLYRSYGARLVYRICIRPRRSK